MLLIKMNHLCINYREESTKEPGGAHVFLPKHKKKIPNNSAHEPMHHHPYGSYLSSKAEALGLPNHVSLLFKQ